AMSVTGGWKSMPRTAGPPGRSFTFWPASAAHARPVAASAESMREACRAPCLSLRIVIIIVTSSILCPVGEPTDGRVGHDQRNARIASTGFAQGVVRIHGQSLRTILA